MKKTCAFLSFSLILFFVFACTFPSEVELSGSPYLTFAANMDFGNFFNGMTDNIVNADSKSKMLLVSNPSLDYMVYVLRMEILKNENYRCEADLNEFMPDEYGKLAGNLTIDGTEIPVIFEDGEDKKFLVVANDKTIAESDDPYTISFSGIEDYLEGFEFKGVHAKIYISGSKLADAVSIDLHQVNSDGTLTIIAPDGEIIKGASGIESLGEYDGPDLPPGGADINISDIINNGGDLSLKYRIYLPGGDDKRIDYDLILETHTIVAEIVIWLPMTFESIKENAIIKFPDFFNGVGDALKSFSGIGCIENMNMKIAINPLNPFSNGLFIMSDDFYGDIPCPLDDYNFYINFSKEQIDYINKNQFNPHFFILYPDENSELKIPKGEIMITTVSLFTMFIYNMEFQK